MHADILDFMCSAAGGCQGGRTAVFPQQARVLCCFSKALVYVSWIAELARWCRAFGRRSSGARKCAPQRLTGCCSMPSVSCAHSAAHIIADVKAVFLPAFHVGLFDNCKTTAIPLLQITCRLFLPYFVPCPIPWVPYCAAAAPAGRRAWSPTCTCMRTRTSAWASSACRAAPACPCTTTPT